MGKSSLWCSPDCKQEESDWKYINNYRKTLQLLRKKNPDGSYTVRKRGRPKSAIPLKERKHAYYLKHKEKIKQQMKIIRERNKINKKFY